MKKNKQLTITPEIRNRMNIKLAQFRKEEPPIYMGASTYHNLLHFYEDKGTIREDIYNELCGII